MRVLLVNKFWKPLGGVEEHCRYLIDWLVAEGHEVVRFGMADPANDPKLPDRQSVSEVSFHGSTLKSNARAALRACVGLDTRRAIQRLLRDHPVDIAHVVHAYHQLGMTFLPVLRKAKVPIVLDLHDYKIGCSRYLLFNDDTREVCTVCIDKPGAWLWAPVTRRCWKGSRGAGVLLAAESLSSRVVGAYTDVDQVVLRNKLQVQIAEGRGVPSKKIHLIRPWVDTGTPPRRLDKDQEALFIGRLVAEKGVDTLIKAAALSGVAVRIVGTGPEEGELMSLASELDAPVTFAGQKDHDGVLAELQQASVLVVPSVWPEIFGLVICEAFAASVPVIGASAGAITELLDESRGYLFQPRDDHGLADLLSQVAESPEEAARRAARAHAYASSHLSYDRWRDGYRQVYARLRPPA